MTDTLKKADILKAVAIERMIAAKLLEQDYDLYDGAHEYAIAISNKRVEALEHILFVCGAMSGNNNIKIGEKSRLAVR